MSDQRQPMTPRAYKDARRRAFNEATSYADFERRLQAIERQYRLGSLNIDRADAKRGYACGLRGVPLAPGANSGFRYGWDFGHQEHRRRITRARLAIWVAAGPPQRRGARTSTLARLAKRLRMPVADLLAFAASPPESLSTRFKTRLAKVFGSNRAPDHLDIATAIREIADPPPKPDPASVSDETREAAKRVVEAINNAAEAVAGAEPKPVRFREAV
jgi:hypothetical protein